MKKTMLLLCLSLFATSQALAHVTNEETAYSDIALSQAAPDILLLDMLGIFSTMEGSRDFRPQEPLLAAEFAEWMDHFPFEYQAVDSDAEGEVHFEDINRVLFDGQLEPEVPGKGITREEFAVFVAAHAETEIDGETLLSRAGFEKGPAGEITGVEQDGEGYQLTIGGKPYHVGAHPRIQSDSADPEVWAGMTVAESLMGPDRPDGQSEAGKTQQNQAIQFAVIERDIAEALPAETKENAIKVDVDPEAGRINWVTAVTILGVALFVYMIYRRNRKDIE